MFHNQAIAELAALSQQAADFRAQAQGCSITARGNEAFAEQHLSAELCDRKARELADAVKTPRQLHADKCRRVMLRVAYAMRGPSAKLGRAALMRREWAVEKQFS